MKHPLVLLAAGIGPGLFWLWWFYRRDRYEPEPQRLILRTALIGGLAGIVAVVLELPWHASVVLGSVVVAPVVEELAKFAVVRRTMYDDPEFDEPMDGLVYAAAAALGFASLENVFYVAACYVKGGEHSAAGTFWARAVLSVPGHALFSSLWGAALGKVRFSPPELRRGIVGRGLVLAMAGHGAWNAICMIRGAYSWILCAFVLFLWGVFNRNARDLLRQSPFREKADPAQPDPGRRI